MSELRDTGERYEMDEQGLTSYADYRRDGGQVRALDSAYPGECPDSDLPFCA